MAKQPPRDERAKKRADDTAEVYMGGPKTPQPKATHPKTPVPQMSIDEPVEDAEEVLEADAVEEAAPAEEIEAELITGDEVESAEPVEDAEEVLDAEDAVEVTGSSAVLAEPPVVAEPSSGRAKAPASDVDLMSLFDEAPGKPASGARKGSEPTPDPEAEMMAKHGKSPARSDSDVAEAAPISDVQAEEAVFEEAIAEPVEAEEVAEAAPVSDVAEAAPVSDVAEAAPVSDVVEAAPVSDVVEAAPASDVFAAEEVAEPAPESAVEAVEAVEEIAEAEPAVAEPVAHAPHAVSEAAHAPPESAVMHAQEAAAVGPESAVMASSEQIGEIAEAPSGVKGEEVVYGDAIGAASNPTEIHSGVVEAEVADFVEEPSSATRKAEAVLDDEVAEVVEAVSDDKTLAYEPPSSQSKKVDDDVLVTEEEIDVSTPASAVDLGDAPKGSSVTGIDKVAEALESGVGIDAEEETPASMKKTAGSVEFDELLDDLGDSSQEIPTSKKKKKTVGKLSDEATELDTEAVEAEAAEADDEAPKKGKKKAKVKATGDDIDLNDLFGDEAKPAEGEAAEEEVAAAEAEAEGEEAVAAEAEDEDEKPKKGKKGKPTGDEDEEEETSAKKSKGKKEKATPAPAPAGGGGLIRILIGMVLAAVIIIPVLGAIVFVAPDQIASLATMAGAKQQPAPPKGGGGGAGGGAKEHVESDLEKAHKLMDEGKFDEAVTLLDKATDPADVGVRGEARWLNHFKKNGAVEHADLKGVRDDLKTGKRDLLLKQIDAQIAAALKEGDLNDQIAAANKGKMDAEKQLASAKTEVANANAATDAATKQLTAAKTELAKALTVSMDATKQITAANDEKLKAQKTIDSLADVLVRGKVITKKGDLDLAMMEKVLQALNDDRAALDTATKQLKDAETARTRAEKERAEILKTIDDNFKELVAAKIVIDPKEDPRKNKILTEINFFRSREPFIESPQQKLNTYIALLQDRTLNNAKQLADINRETAWVLAPESKSDDDARGKARYVQGLALRNQERFTEARKAYEEALELAKGAKSGVWVTYARKSLAELTDPRAYYLPRIESFRAAENFSEAHDEATAALKVMPNESVLSARRGLIRLELIKGKGPKISEEAQQGIRADAEAAAKDAKLAGESAYLLGLLEEELHNWPEAEKQFRMAIKLSDDKGSEEESGKYRVALARLLLRDRDAAPAAPAPPADEKKKDDKSVSAVRAGEERVIVMHPWTPLIVSAVIAQPVDPNDDPAAQARLKEAIDEANKLIASKNEKLRGEGYLALGKALTRMGKRTDGLKAYAEGLRLLHKGIGTKELQELIDEHPAFQQPDVSGVANPVMAERHFADGLHHYWARQYPEAEQQFRQAVRYYDKDARYQYFLGLSQLNQKGKRGAALFSFEKGARLETSSTSTNPLVVRDINASLERVQGEQRQLLNSYRYKVSPVPSDDSKQKDADADS